MKIDGICCLFACIVCAFAGFFYRFLFTFILCVPSFVVFTSILSVFLHFITLFSIFSVFFRTFSLSYPFSFQNTTPPVAPMGIEVWNVARTEDLLTAILTVFGSHQGATPNPGEARDLVDFTCR